jgi:hypothetical protein
VRSVTYTYDQVTAPATRVGPCPGCGQKVKRSRTFSQTVNPWNTTEEDGVKRPKTYAEVRKSVNEQAMAWEPDPETFRHGKCAE